MGSQILSWGSGVDGKGKRASRAGGLEPGSPGRVGGGQGAPQFCFSYKERALFIPSLPPVTRGLLQNHLMVLLLSTFLCHLDVFPNEQVYFENQQKAMKLFSFATRSPLNHTHKGPLNSS